jgi:hypothetical protein
MSQNIDETTPDATPDCEASVNFTFHHLGFRFMEPSDYLDAPLSKTLLFILRVGLLGSQLEGDT